jgi:hypothetical protein
MRAPLAAGTPVLLAFLEGDPDRPVIVGVLPTPRGGDPGPRRSLLAAPGASLVLDDGPGAPHLALAASASGVRLGTLEDGTAGISQWTGGDAILATGGSLVEVQASRVESTGLGRFTFNGGPVVLAGGSRLAFAPLAFRAVCACDYRLVDGMDHQVGDLTVHGRWVRLGGVRLPGNHRALTGCLAAATVLHTGLSLALAIPGIAGLQAIPAALSLFSLNLLLAHMLCRGMETGQLARRKAALSLDGETGIARMGADRHGFLEGAVFETGPSSTLLRMDRDLMCAFTLESGPEPTAFWRAEHALAKFVGQEDGVSLRFAVLDPQDQDPQTEASWAAGLALDPDPSLRLAHATGGLACALRLTQGRVRLERKERGGPQSRITFDTGGVEWAHGPCRVQVDRGIRIRDIRSLMGNRLTGKVVMIG